VWSCDPKSYAGGTISIRKVSHAIQVSGEDQDKEWIPWSSILGFGQRIEKTTL
jgi:hypothetical protein